MPSGRMVSDLKRASTTSDDAGTTLTSGGILNDPLGLVIPRNRIFTVNGNDGFSTEITAAGGQIRVYCWTARARLPAPEFCSVWLLRQANGSTPLMTIQHT